MEGAPNLREVEGYGVFGVAIPTVSGVRNTLNELKGIKEQRGEKEEVLKRWDYFGGGLRIVLNDPKKKNRLLFGLI